MVANEEFAVESLEPNMGFIDPEDDKDNWPVIIIDPVEGLSNYEFVAAHGTKKNGEAFSHECQIMRGVDVPVPPSIVNVLKIATSAKYKQVQDPITGTNRMVRTDQSSIPWRMVRGGKYFA